MKTLTQDTPNDLKPLAPSTIRRRRGKRLSSKTNPEKSNLTETGEMLDSLVGTLRGKLASVVFKTDSAAKKAELNRDTRPFEVLSLSEVRKLRSFLQKLISRR